MGDMILDACIQFENYPIKTVEVDAFYRHYVLYHYFKISKIRQKFKNNPIVKRSTSQVGDMILDACMKFENYPIKTVGVDAFYRHYVLYHYFKISKIRQKFKNNPIVKRSTSQVGDMILHACIEFENYSIKTVGVDAFYRHYVLYHYFKISKIRQKFKNNPIVKRSTSQVGDTILDACMKFENYPIKTVGVDAFYRHYVLYHYFKISKIRQKFKNYPIVKRSTSQVGDMILDAYIEFENYPIKTVGVDAFYRHYVLYHYFKISKIRQKFKNNPIVKKSTSQVGDMILDACMKFENYPIKTVGVDAFYSYYILYHYFKILKIRQKFKNGLIVKKSTSQMSDIIFDVCIEFENYPMKTVGEEAFYSYYKLYHYFKISKIRQKFKNSPIVKKSTSQVSDIILDACIKFESYPTKTVGGDRF